MAPERGDLNETQQLWGPIQVLGANRNKRMEAPTAPRGAKLAPALCCAHSHAHRSRRTGASRPAVSVKQVSITKALWGRKVDHLKTAESSEAQYQTLSARSARRLSTADAVLVSSASTAAQKKGAKVCQAIGFLPLRKASYSTLFRFFLRGISEIDKTHRKP